MNENTIDAEDQQLNYNLQKLNSELCFLIDDQQPVQIAGCSKGGAAKSALQEFNPRVHELAFDSSAPQFEFHRFGCIESRLMGRRQILSSNTDHQKKPKSNAIQYANLLQKENISVELTMDQIKFIELFGNWWVRQSDIDNNLYLKFIYAAASVILCCAWSTCSSRCMSFSMQTFPVISWTQYRPIMFSSCPASTPSRKVWIYGIKCMWFAPSWIASLDGCVAYWSPIVTSITPSTLNAIS